MSPWRYGGRGVRKGFDEGAVNQSDDNTMNLRKERDQLAARLEEYAVKMAELEIRLQEKEDLLESMATSLVLIRDLCKKSPAARSIICGVASNDGYESLFEPVKEQTCNM